MFSREQFDKCHVFRYDELFSLFLYGTVPIVNRTFAEEVDFCYLTLSEGLRLGMTDFPPV